MHVGRGRGWLGTLRALAALGCCWLHVGWGARGVGCSAPLCKRLLAAVHMSAAFLLRPVTSITPSWPTPCTCNPPPLPGTNSSSGPTTLTLGSSPRCRRPRSMHPPSSCRRKMPPDPPQGCRWPPCTYPSPAPAATLGFVHITVLWRVVCLFTYRFFSLQPVLCACCRCHLTTWQPPCPLMRGQFCGALKAPPSLLHGAIELPTSRM